MFPEPCPTALLPDDVALSCPLPPTTDALSRAQPTTMRGDWRKIRQARASVFERRRMGRKGSVAARGVAPAPSPVYLPLARSCADYYDGEEHYDRSGAGARRAGGGRRALAEPRG